MAFILTITERRDGVAVAGDGLAGTDLNKIAGTVDRELYRQEFDDLDLPKIIRAANGMRDRKILRKLRRGDRGQA